MSASYTRAWAAGARLRLASVRNQVIATRTGLELGASPEDLLPDIEQALHELLTIRNQLRRMYDSSPDKAFTLPGERV
jgi:hypothetical protein